MSTRRALAVLWLAAGVVLWIGVFDLYIREGIRAYLQLRAEFELGLVPEPSMTGVMAGAQRRGILGASIWAAAVVLLGWLTIRLAAKPAGRG